MKTNSALAAEPPKARSLQRQKPRLLRKKPLPRPPRGRQIRTAIVILVPRNVHTWCKGAGWCTSAYASSLRCSSTVTPEGPLLTPAGYRDIALQVEVGWIVGKDGMCWFVPVSHWKSDVRVDRLVCEVQIQVKDCVHRGQASDEQHTRYIKFRDWFGR
uniref:Uncharacterized protein n=1 Tax=Hemiselmis andersenii TaxID=464988 RepID=A0A6U2CUY5_HEMAN|mmetsp:Transcript_21797/g.50583  ORF Transcript_21797/g.50583 Transcript_21797/m.50583 type:complete len:158 (+) Transcript_21797:117-590(+)